MSSTLPAPLLPPSPPSRSLSSPHTPQSSSPSPSSSSHLDHCIHSLPPVPLCRASYLLVFSPSPSHPTLPCIKNAPIQYYTICQLSSLCHSLTPAGHLGNVDMMFGHHRSITRAQCLFVFVVHFQVLALPDGFVYLAQVDSTIVQELRYAQVHNFVGRQIPGYNAPTCILTKQAAEGLTNVQKMLMSKGYALKLYDCYRPQQAVDFFFAWSQDPADIKMKNEFYPEEDKARLFERGYIAKQSGHSRGSTMDLTIVPWPPPAQPVWEEGDPLTPCTAPLSERFPDNSLDFGTGFDCFDPRSFLNSTAITSVQEARRQFLTMSMGLAGFQGYDKEWWHFTLVNEPFPNTYFDFPIEFVQ